MNLKRLLCVGIGLTLMASAAMAADTERSLVPLSCVEIGNASDQCLHDLAAVANGAEMIYEPATKSVAGCTNIPIASSFDEQPDGSNCPPTAFEKAVGDIGFGLVAFAVGAEAIGANLNAGILSGL